MMILAVRARTAGNVL